MNKEVVIIKRFLIDKPKQLKAFDIKIPRHVKQIIGVELGMTMQSGILPRHPRFNSKDGFLKIYRNIHIGELKLQSLDSSKLFYTQELIQYQNFIYGDFSSKQFHPSPYTHQRHSLEDPIYLSGASTLIQGIYQDQLELPTAYSYIVQVYLWLENK